MLAIVAVLAIIVGAALWSRRGLTLALAREHAVVGRVLAASLRESAAPLELAGAVSILDEPGRQPATRAALQEAVAKGRDEPVDFGFGEGDAASEIRAGGEGSVELPAVATALLRAQKNPLLIVHTRQTERLARIASRRGWLGPLAAEVFASARSISAALDEDREAGWLRITLALEFTSGEAAEQALARLSSANGDYGQLGFVAQPGYERIVRQTRLVVIRLDTRTETAARQLRGR